MADPVSGKVKNGTLAAVVASTLVGALVELADHKVPAVKPLLDNVAVSGGIVGFAAGVATFVTGYITRHLPAELVKDIRAEVPPTA